jgi:cell division inhibitor SulA
MTADDKALRRLQVAAESGQCLGVAFRPARAAANPSPAPLRLQLDADGDGPRLRVLKCRGAQPPAQALRLGSDHIFPREMCPDPGSWRRH